MALLGRCMMHCNSGTVEPYLPRKAGQTCARKPMGRSPWCFTPCKRTLRICSFKEGGPSSAPTVAIRLQYRVNYGEVVRVVGSSPILGNWSAEDGLQLSWTEGDVWTAEVPIDAGFHEFKCVVYNVETNSVDRWEDGANRILNIPQEPGTWDVSCAWGATADMTQAFTPAMAPPAPVAAAEAAPAAPAVETPEAASLAPEPVAAVVEEQQQLPTFMALQEEPGSPSEGTAAPSLESRSDPVLTPLAMPADASGAAALDLDEPSASGRSGGGGVGGAVAFLLATCAAGAVAVAAVLSPGGLDAAAGGGGGGLGSLGGRANELLSTTIVQSSLAGAQVRAQVSSQLSAATSALAGHVSAVQAQVAAVAPAVQAGVASVQAQVAAVPPAVQAGVASVQAQVAAVPPAVQAGVASVQDGVADGLSSLEPMVRGGVAVVQGHASALQARATAVVSDAADRLAEARPLSVAGRQG